MNGARTMRTGLAALLVAAAFATAARADEAPANVKITVVRAVASGTRESQAAPTVDAKLDKVRGRLLALPLSYASYVHEGTDERRGAWSSKVSLTSADGVSLTLVPTASEGGKVKLAVEERNKGAEKPCIVTTIETGPNAPAAVFCDKVPGPATLIFFVSAETL